MPPEARAAERPSRRRQRGATPRSRQSAPQKHSAASRRPRTNSSEPSRKHSRSRAKDRCMTPRRTYDPKPAGLIWAPTARRCRPAVKSCSTARPFLSIRAKSMCPGGECEYGVVVEHQSAGSAAGAPEKNLEAIHIGPDGKRIDLPQIVALVDRGTGVAGGLHVHVLQDVVAQLAGRQQRYLRSRQRLGNGCRGAGTSAARKSPRPSTRCN